VGNISLAQSVQAIIHSTTAECLKYQQHTRFYQTGDMAIKQPRS